MTTATLPKLTDEERQAALQKAHAANRRRAEALQRLARHDIDFAGLLALADEDEAVGHARVSTALRRLPGVGPKRLPALMADAGIDDRRRLGGLGSRQRTYLAALTPSG
jgi:hypothetical protein